MSLFCDITEKQLLNSARGVTQFNIRGERIVTIIGELHMLEFDCDNGKTMYQYCVERATANPRCKFLFEYPPDGNFDFKRVGSNIMQDVFVRNGDNVVKSRCKGVDSRLVILGKERQQNLYNNTKGYSAKYGDNDELLFDDYVESYKNTRKDPVDTICEKNLREYGEEIDSLFNGFSTDPPERQDLKWAWSKMMDYNAMWEMTSKQANTNEIIVIVGNNHRINIFQSMKDWECCELIKNLENINGNKNKCINMGNIKTVCDL